MHPHYTNSSMVLESEKKKKLHRGSQELVQPNSMNNNNFPIIKILNRACPLRSVCTAKSLTCLAF